MRGGRLLFASLFLGVVDPSSAQTVEEQKEFADGLYSRGMHEMAIREYQKTLEPDSQRIAADEVLFRMAEAYRALDDPRAADEMYRRVFTEHPHGKYRHKAEFRRAELYIEERRFGDASILLEELLEADPPNELQVPSLYFLGSCYERTGDLEKAEKNFERVTNVGDNHPYVAYACLALAQIYMKDEAKVDQVTKLLERVAQVSESDRLAAEAQFLLGDVAYRKGDFEASAQAYRRLLQIYPKDRRAEEADLQAAWSYVKAGHYEEALKLAEPGLADPDERRRGEWSYLQANSLRLAGQTKEALAAYATFNEAFPDHDRASVSAYEHGLLLFRQGRHNEALNLLLSVKATEQIAEDLEWLKAEAALGADRAEHALEAFQTLLKSFPESERTPIAAYRYARVQQDLRRFEPAVAAYRTMIEAYPKHKLAPDALMGAAYCETRLERFVDARTRWRSLVQDYPDTVQHEQALFQLALADMHLENEDDARKTLQTFLNDYPESEQVAEAAYWLAVLHDKQSDFLSATTYFEQARQRAVEDALHAKATMGLATVLKKKGEDAKAADLWQSLLSSSNEHLDASLLEWLARFQLQRTRYHEATVAAQALADVARDHEAWQEIAWYLVGQARLALDQNEEAMQAFERAASGDSGTRESIEAAFHFAELSRHAGQWDQAAAYYEKTVEKASKPDMMDLRARSYYGLGQAAVAREAWEEAARLFMSVGILFDHPELTPDALFQAAYAFGILGKDQQKAKAEAELVDRYSNSIWAKKLSQKEEP